LAEGNIVPNKEVQQHYSSPILTVVQARIPAGLAFYIFSLIVKILILVNLLIGNREVFEDKRCSTTYSGLYLLATRIKSSYKKINGLNQNIFKITKLSKQINM